MTQHRPAGQRLLAPGKRTLFEINPVCHPTSCFSFVATQVQMTLQQAQGLLENIPSWGGAGSPPGKHQMWAGRKPRGGSAARTSEKSPGRAESLLGVVCLSLRAVSEATRPCGTSLWSAGPARDTCGDLRPGASRRRGALGFPCCLKVPRVPQTVPLAEKH